MAWLAGLILASRSHAVSFLQFDASFRQSIAMSNVVTAAQVHDFWDGETDHCLALEWSPGMTIDLAEYLTADSLDVIDDFRFKVNGVFCNGLITLDLAPRSLRPEVYAVTVERTSVILDRLWVTVYSRDDFDAYVNWQTDNPNTLWTTNLPPSNSAIALTTNGESVNVDRNREYPDWKKPSALKSYLHHNASYSMRSEAIGEHGHQATYDANGNLILDSIAAGTSDFRHPLSLTFSGKSAIRDEHYTHDVVPFLRAIFLDGNPCRYNYRYAPTNLNRPALYQGQYLNDYLLRRPPLPTGVQMP